MFCIFRHEKGRKFVLSFTSIRYQLFMTEEFVEIFEYLMQKVYSPYYHVKMTSRNVNAIIRFFENSKIDSVDEIWKYLLFQLVLSMNRYSNRYSVTLLKCISINAIKRWNERTEEKMFLVSKFQRVRRLENPLQNKVHLYSERYLNEQRKKYWNTPRGFIHCGEFNGILYHKIRCFGCRYKESCEKVLEL